jgi:hypothetical protein
VQDPKKLQRRTDLQAHSIDRHLANELLARH